MIRQLNSYVILLAILLHSCSVGQDEKQKKRILEDNRNIIGHIYSKFESGDVNALDNYVDENLIEHTPDPLILQKGIDGLKELIRINHNAFPDLKIKVYNISVEGDLAYSHFNWRGTNTGPIRTSAPTMKIIDIDGVDIIRIKDGKIIEHWGYWDTLKFLNQLGSESQHPSD